MLDFVGTIVTTALMVFVVTALLVFMDISRRAKLTVAALLGLWIGLAAAAGAAGWLSIARPFPIIGLFVAAPLFAAAVATAWPAARRAMLSPPLPQMVGLNIGRVAGVLFLLLAAEGRLSGPVPYSAGWGDIIAGALALPVLWLMQENGRHTTPIHLWNAFGMADLVTAIALGVTSTANSPLGIFRDGAGSDAMQHLPWSFVPTVLVPIYMILHAIIWVRLYRPALLTA
jgi:hypothetical protein